MLGLGILQFCSPLDDNVLARIQVDTQQMEDQREKLYRDYIKGNEEIDRTERVLTAEETKVMKSKDRTTEKLVAQKVELKGVLEAAAAEVAGGSTPGPAARLAGFLAAAVARKAAGLECTICLAEASTPVYGCSEYHLLCGGCRGKVASCSCCSKCDIGATSSV